LRADVAPSDVAAIIIEPVQGEGGFLPAPIALLQALRRRCDELGILLIADEVQSGFARTGKMFGIEASGVEPDLVTDAKSLAGGFPLSGVIGRASIMDAVEPGGLGGTYAGNPVACAAALAVLDIIREEGLTARADVLGARARAYLERIAAAKGAIPIRKIRGPGAMIAFDVVTPDGAPDAAAAKRLVAEALQQGLLLLSCGVHGNSIRLLFALVISDELLDEGLRILERCLIRAS
jgi:4-aminobutyrate aminotransferase/(S)-3-amino-2-methylpropionate transaminase